MHAWLRYRWWCSRVLEALAIVLQEGRESRTHGWAHQPARETRTQCTRRGDNGARGAVVGVCIVEFVVRPVIAVLLVVLIVKGHNINDGLRIFALFLLTDAISLQRDLPLLRKTLGF